MSNTTVRCPDCNGAGKHEGVSLRGGGQWVEIECPFCQGTGAVMPYRVDWFNRGKAMRHRRVHELHAGLREFAELIGMSPSEYSRMEQGITEPDESLIEKARRIKDSTPTRTQT